ncbi:PIG-L family deacetylase [Sulfurimonas paralvinellae]|uniref:PIG-L family deacetylase n=1 Tax=Sulfurimonas paralvinellae TaxID=317658 RepID=A0A7M1B8T8_9BACT|nr:PIG-L family deacetylase [Sulfurimonas paralvinellae]QOP46124.1 hypothetical protein FM071_07405 [Sulfurimonas paralvinellae]
MFYIIFLFVLFYLVIIVKRAKQYKYNTKEDYLYDLEKNFIQNINLNDKIHLTNDKYDTLFLQIKIKPSFFSYFIQPCITINGVKHFFEYGAAGIRYVNFSHAGETTEIKGNISLQSKSARLYGYKNNIDLENDTILILAPHADDAELAAFGLYKSAKNVTIVTITAGESGVCNYCDLYKNNKEKSALKKGSLRTFDALTVPMLGNIPYTNSLTLGYFGSSLQKMAENPRQAVKSKIDTIENMEPFRKVSHAKVKLDNNVLPTYTSLLKDLNDLITQLNPNIIITPHSQIDSHADHKQTTYAVRNILKRTHKKIKFLLYTNHLVKSEIYPLGDIHSAVTLPPNSKKFDFDSIYSFALDEELQIDKLFALEAIHDLKDSTIQISLKKSLIHLKKMFMRVITGKDKSYFRRAVRANELFFISDKPL